MSISKISWTSTSSAMSAEKNALFAGVQADGKKVYVGKFLNGAGEWVPAKIIPELNLCYYEEGGSEKSSDKVEYLSDSQEYEWVKISENKNIQNAVSLEDHFIGKADVGGSTVVGRIDPITKKLTASYDGKILSLSDYEVLVFKPQNITKGAYKTEKYQEVQERILVKQKFHQQNALNFSGGNKGYNEKIIIRESAFNQNQHKFLEMQNRIQNLELELQTYKNDRINYEQRIAAERGRVEELNKKIQALKIENSTFTSEHATFKEKYTTEVSKISDLRLKYDDVLNENAFLLKKITNLEDALKTERYQMEVYTNKFKSSKLTDASLPGKIKGLEDKIKNQQQRIFELESIIENTNSNGDSLRSQITTYESTIEHQKMQVDGILKKLQAANADNEFLVKKVGLLTQSLRNYQYEIEQMSAQLQNAKTIIAAAHAELARANAQIAKYQAALSSSYVLNGELMSKVSNFSAMSQYQTSFDSKYDILKLNLSAIEGGAQKINFNTSALLEATGSESFLKFSNSDLFEIGGLESNVEKINITSYSSSTSDSNFDSVGIQ